MNGKSVVSEKANTWCKREGHNRVCLSCGRNIRSNPKCCLSLNHRKTFVTRRAYNSAYFQKHKARLVNANARYRKNHKSARQWMIAYGKKWYAINREKKLAQNKAWEQEHRDKRVHYLREKARQWYYRHRQRALRRNRQWYFENRTRKNRRRSELLKAQRARDPGARIRFNLRCRLSTLLKRAGEKTFSITRNILLYTAAELRTHLERQFTPNMSWANYGRYWEVDHIRACAEFDLADLVQCQACFALANLRPLKMRRNRSRYHEDRRRRLK